MCSECGDSVCGADGDPICSWCGTECLGSCSDPDTCGSCWSNKHDPTSDSALPYEIWDSLHEDCIDTKCRCECHVEDYEGMEIRFEHGVWWTEDDEGYDFVREGVFPFLTLAAEIRDKIYGFAFLQDGNRRRQPYHHHRGTIHTALLRTCRQVYREAGHLPLSLNTVNFSSALCGLDFLGFSLVPNKKHLLTSVHIEFNYYDFSTLSWELLLKHLAEMPITHLGLTIKGAYHQSAFLGHDCFAKRFAAVMKGIKTFDVSLCSRLCDNKVEEEIQEQMRETLIEGYKRPKDVKEKKTKRNASNDTGDDKPAKKAKKATKASKPKHQAKLVLSPKAGKLRVKSTKAERDAAEAAKTQKRQMLLAQHDQLKQYATSIDFDAGPVKLRLEDARKAAEAVDEPEFVQLARSISETLDERFNRIATARNNVPRFASSLPIIASTVAGSLQGTHDCLSTQGCSQDTVDEIKTA